MTKKKKNVFGGGLGKIVNKLGRKKIIVFLIAIIIIGAAAYFVVTNASADELMTASCSGKKGKCTEQTIPSATGDKVSFNIVAKDSKTKQELSGYKFSGSSSVKKCYKAGSPGHPKGGCVNETISFADINVSNSTITNDANLCSIDTKYYVDGTANKTMTSYIPCLDPSSTGFGAKWNSTTYQIKDSNGKILGKIKVSAPFGYTSNKSKALAALKKLENKTYYLNVKNAASAVSADEGTSISSDPSYSLRVYNNYLPVRFGDDISKKCKVKVTIGSKVKTSSCNSSGDYATMNLSGISSSVKEVVFSASDIPIFKDIKQNTTTISFDKLANLPSDPNHFGNLAQLGSSDRQLSCSRENKAIKCIYSPILK